MRLPSEGARSLAARVMRALVHDAVDARLIAADHAGELFLSTAMGDSPIIRLTPQGVLPASYAGSSRSATAELVTIAADRTAIMSLHLFDGEATAITYFGTCEELT